MEPGIFKQLPIIGILRGIEEEMVEPILDIVQSSGLKALEITMNTPEAAKLIKRMASSAQGRPAIGAGTVLTLDDLHSALDAGATFIVLPTLVEEVVQYCVSHNIPVFPGALTPSEIHRAWSSGATMVKVFPAKFFGPDYFKEIKGPFQDVELLACGGVTSENVDLFFSSGASGVAFGGSIFKTELLKAKEFNQISDSLNAFIHKYHRWNNHHDPQQGTLQ